MAPLRNKYSVILPTYNERQNLPVLVQMLHDVFEEKYASSLVDLKLVEADPSCPQQAQLGDHHCR